jgi:hypothetical protein
MTTPKPFAIGVVVAALLAAAGTQAVRSLYPPLRTTSNPTLDALRSQKAQMQDFTNARTAQIDAKIAELHRQLWTPQTFSLWQKNNIPDGWTIQDLGQTDAQHVLGRRFAFQRPNATDQQWNEILGVLKTLETTHCVNVQSATMAVRPGYAGSREFSQCVVITIFYYTPKT